MSGTLQSIPGDPTVTAIIWFQREIAGFTNPDGLVSPNRKTHQALLGYKAKIQKASKPAIHDEVTQKPLQLGPTQAAAYLTLVSYNSGVIHAGDTWLAVDGQRVVHQASYSGVVYVLLKPRGQVKPGTYIQNANAFVSDVNVGAVAGEISSRCAN